MPMVSVRPETARRELARRELARRHLMDFSGYMAAWYRKLDHLQLLASKLEETIEYLRTGGEQGIGRLLIFMPPRYGKSQLASRMYPAWALGQLARKQLSELRIILASYGADLAEGNSRAVRDLVSSEKYQALFGALGTVDEVVTLSNDSRSVTGWDLAAPLRGGVNASGVGGALTGKGAHILIVDDPVKNREEAESEARRDTIWDWWTSTAYTRLEDNAVVIGMMTRWHADDWAGRLLKAMANDPLADQWEVISLPAIAEEIALPEGLTFEEYQRQQMMDGVWVNERDPLGRQAGEALWPDKYDEADLERIKVNVGEYDYEALYNQSPYSRSGTLFQREWFAIVEAAPKVEEIAARMWFIDTAGSKDGKKSDYAVALCMSLGKDDLVYVENVARRQGTPMECDKMIMMALNADRLTGRPIGAIWHQQEGGDSGLRAAQLFNKTLAKEGYAGKFETMSGDKEVRAGPWSSALQGNQVRLVRGGWNTAFIEEHVGFPKKKYDDQVDAASWGYGKLAGRAVRKSAKSYQG